MAAANNEFFEALSMLEHERGITAEYLIEKIKAAIIIAVKKKDVYKRQVKILCFPFEKHARQWGKLPERYNNDTANQPRTERMYYNGTERKDP